MQLIDPLTGKPFTPRRTNQIFASRANQIKYNNLLASQKRKAKAPVQQIMNSNRNIIIAVLSGDKEAIRSKDYMLGAGFNFSCMTHSKREGDIVFYYIYEFSYIKLENNYYKFYSHANS